MEAASAKRRSVWAFSVSVASAKGTYDLFLMFIVYPDLGTDTTQQACQCHEEDRQTSPSQIAVFDKKWNVFICLVLSFKIARMMQYLSAARCISLPVFTPQTFHYHQAECQAQYFSVLKENPKWQYKTLEKGQQRDCRMNSQNSCATFTCSFQCKIVLCPTKQISVDHFSSYSWRRVL